MTNEFPFLDARQVPLRSNPPRHRRSFQEHQEALHRLVLVCRRLHLVLLRYCVRHPRFRRVSRCENASSVPLADVVSAC